MIKIEDYSQIGYITKTHGVKGNLYCETNVDLSQLEELEFIFLKIDNYLVPHFVESVTISSHTSILIKLEDVDIVEQAAKLKGKELFLPKEIVKSLIDTDSDYRLIIGFDLFDHKSENLIGKVTDVENYSNNIVMKVEDNIGNEILIPLSEDIITGLDEDDQTITIDVPEGLLELYISDDPEDEDEENY